MNPLHPVNRHTFASDNLAGIHPEVLAAIASANGGHVDSYGEDPYTEQLQQVLRSHFGPGVTAFPVLNGTGANVLALQAVTPRWGAVLTPHCAHINLDEAGAPERSAGLKIVSVPSPDGKLRPEQIHAAAQDLGNQHHAQVTTVSISNVTELGTAYTPQETAALAKAAHAHGMALHVDGSRLVHAAEHLGVGLGQLTSGAGVDVLSLGGTKNGAMLAEAVVTFTEAGANAVPLLRKGSLQLVSKLRFVSAQLIALYGSELWRNNAAHANRLAARLGQELQQLDGVELAQPVQSNAVFVSLPQAMLEPLRQQFTFHGAGTPAAPARLMCAFDTPGSAVTDLLAAARLLSQAQ
ncbi:threonine aldolase family protein [Galactobacter caseinivorans]|uniref:threonine aldolase family protein n=1 Tax=Galactobacter caseinivorans TaxID=2676123 RepID=UPI001F38888A|nr:beta-eliminating lyase-related protein [Galactobacter caseinivorans]